MKEGENCAYNLVVSRFDSLRQEREKVNERGVERKEGMGGD